MLSLCGKGGILLGDADGGDLVRWTDTLSPSSTIASWSRRRSERDETVRCAEAATDYGDGETEENARVLTEMKGGESCVVDLEVVA